MIGHDDARHGTQYGYVAGCRQACCRAAHAAAQRAWRLDPGRLIDSAATRRRLDALNCRGWSTQELSLRLGRRREYLRKVRCSARLQRATVEKVAALYDELRDLDNPAPYAARTRREARDRGAIPPEGWLDIERGLLAVVALDEKPCCCPTTVPNRRTAYALQCMGCGWGYALGAAS